MTRKLEGRVALVTGGGKNIGRAIVLALADLGASVAVHGLTDPAAAEATAQDAAAKGGAAMAFTADVADYAEVERLGQEVKDRLGPVEILVSNAAIRPGASLLELTPELWRRAMAVNLDAAFYLSKVFVPHMLEVGRGSIITIGGPAAFGTSADRAHVAASKAGLIGLTKALATEFAGRHIRANCVVPGTTDTQRAHPEWYAAQDPAQPSHVARVPMGRLGTPQEVAAMCAFLATDNASFITRQVIMVNGGAFL